MAKPKRKNRKGNTVNSHSSKAVHSKKPEVRQNATATDQASLSKILYWFDIAYKILRCVELFLKYWPIDF